MLQIIFAGLLVSFCPAYQHAINKREADYTLDDSFWNEESPVGESNREVERLLREYRQNQELVRNIGAHYYQIIYPVQLRHHEKMGISTREVGALKFPSRGSNDGGNHQGNTSRARSRIFTKADEIWKNRGIREDVKRRTGKHFHRTSLLIKAFNHKFKLDLELNTQLLAPNLMQKHFLPSGAEQVSKQEIEHCYYHGTVKDYPGATAAFHTCNGVSGVIHVGNETFVIHPFYGGDLSKHPHVIFEARAKVSKGCANSGNLEYGRINTFRRSHSGLGPDRQTRDARYSRDLGRYPRDVSEATKYIETALVIDKAMFEKRNGSTRSEVVHDAIQVANIADLYFRTLNTRVSVVYIETWQGSNQAIIDRNQDISRALLNFNDYTSRKLYRIDKDTTQLLTGEQFVGGEAGMSVADTVCTPKSVGISVDVNTYELHLLAGTMAHMIGHNIGMGHDGGRGECVCRDWHGCIMAQSIVGLENVQPYKFSECSRTDYNSALRTGHGICLLNKPNELEVRRSCGNGVVEEGEDCDCGTINECQEMDPCCDPYTCKLKKDAECATGPCCHNCKLRKPGMVCRPATNECDLPEHCTGEHGQCPTDVHKKNGTPCSKLLNNSPPSGYCFNGFCPTLDIQCAGIWGYGGKAGDVECFKQFNTKGTFSGHCGTTPHTTSADAEKHYIKCDLENARCGSLQCQLGNTYPQIQGTDDHHFSRTIISMKGVEYECKSTTSTSEQTEASHLGLVRDGTPCGDNLVCINQTCTSLFPHIDQGKCPTNHNNKECSGFGTCTNVNKCYCEQGRTGPDCSIEVEVDVSPLPEEDLTPTHDSKTEKENLEAQMKGKETAYGKNTDNLSTLTMVFIMVGVVKGVFICFAMIAVCYRRSTMPKFEPPAKKPIVKEFNSTPQQTPDEAAPLDTNKMLSLSNIPGYSGRDSQRVMYRPVNHMVGGLPSSRYQDHKMQQMKRLVGNEDDPSHSVYGSGEEDSVAFIDLPQNNLSKLPEKGILKKPCPYGDDSIHKSKWLEDADNNEDPSADLLAPPISDVERTLKSLNGYHEDLLEALRGAVVSHSRGASASSEDLLRRSLAAAVDRSYSRVNSQEKMCDPAELGHGLLDKTSPSLHHHLRTRQSNQRSDSQDDDEEDEVPPCGPIRIRNLEDLIRQLEHKTTRHMSPSGSEDIRMSETEADRHYNRLDTQPGGHRPSM